MTARTDAAVEWLRDLLAAGPVTRAEVAAAATRAGITERVLRDARERLQLVTERAGKGRDHHTTWRLPDAAATHDAESRTDEDWRLGFCWYCGGDEEDCECC